MTIIVIIIYDYINDNIKVHVVKLFPFWYERASASEFTNLHVWESHNSIITIYNDIS